MEANNQYNDCKLYGNMITTVEKLNNMLRYFPVDCLFLSGQVDISNVLYYIMARMKVTDKFFLKHQDSVQKEFEIIPINMYTLDYSEPSIIYDKQKRSQGSVVTLSVWNKNYFQSLKQQKVSESDFDPIKYFQFETEKFHFDFLDDFFEREVQQKLNYSGEKKKIILINHKIHANINCNEIMNIFLNKSKPLLTFIARDSLEHFSDEFNKIDRETKINFKVQSKILKRILENFGQTYIQVGTCRASFVDFEANYLNLYNLIKNYQNLRDRGLNVNEIWHYLNLFLFIDEQRVYRYLKHQEQEIFQNIDQFNNYIQEQRDKQIQDSKEFFMKFMFMQLDGKYVHQYFCEIISDQLNNDKIVAKLLLLLVPQKEILQVLKNNDLNCNENDCYFFFLKNWRFDSDVIKEQKQIDTQIISNPPQQTRIFQKNEVIIEQDDQYNDCYVNNSIKTSLYELQEILRSFPVDCLFLSGQVKISNVLYYLMSRIDVTDRISEMYNFSLSKSFEFIPINIFTVDYTDPSIHYTQDSQYSGYQKYFTYQKNYFQHLGYSKHPQSAFNPIQYFLQRTQKFHFDFLDDFVDQKLRQRFNNKYPKKKVILINHMIYSNINCNEIMNDIFLQKRRPLLTFIGRDSLEHFSDRLNKIDKDISTNFKVQIKILRRILENLGTTYIQLGTCQQLFVDLQKNYMKLYDLIKNNEDQNLQLQQLGVIWNYLNLFYFIQPEESQKYLKNKNKEVFENIDQLNDYVEKENISSRNFFVKFMFLKIDQKNIYHILCRIISNQLNNDKINANMQLHLIPQRQILQILQNNNINCPETDCQFFLLQNWKAQ